MTASRRALTAALAELTVEVRSGRTVSAGRVVKPGQVAAVLVALMAARDGDAVLTPAEACACLGIERRTLVRWANAGKIRVLRTPGGHRRYPESEVRALLGGGG